jgi:transcriptional regulator with GAF, ATPase, and Fis domain
MAGLLVFAYAGGVLCYVMLTPDIGVRCAFTPVVNQFNDDFLPDFEKESTEEPRLQGDDEIVQIGDQPVTNWAQILRELVRLRQPTGEPGTKADLDPRSGKTHLILGGQEIIRVSYRRAHEETIQHVWLRVGRPPVETLAPSLLWFSLKIILFAVGAIFFWKRPEDRSASHFFLFCLVSFGAYMGGYHWSRIVTQPVLILVFMVCSVLLPAVSLHFYLVFPRPKAFLDRAPRRVLLSLYGPPLGFLLILLWDYFRTRYLFQAGASPERVGEDLSTMLNTIYCYFGVAALWYLASVLCLLHSYRSATGFTERNQVKWILLGTLASLAPIGYSLYLALAERQKFGGGAATWPMFFASLCVTVAFAISITRYRLMQLDQLLNSSVVYFLISSVVGLAYYGICVIFAGMVLLDSRFIEDPTFGQALAAGGTVMLVLVGLDFLRGRITSVLHRHFRREKNQLDHTLRRMSQAIEQLVDPPTLAHRLLHTSAELLGAVRGAIYLRQGQPPLYVLTEALGSSPTLTELSSGCPLVESLQTLQERPLLALHTQTMPIAPGPRQLHFLGGAIAQGLLHEGQLLGILILGPPSELRGLATEATGGYTAEDLYLLSAFVRMTVLALLSAEGHRNIDSLNRELHTKVEKIAEQQRRILALQSQLSAIGHRSTPRTETREPAVAVREPTIDCGVIGSSPQVRRLMQQARKVAVTDSVVMLSGESGTGKELLARAIHENSPRASKPFVAVHCSALSASLLESELFGHVKGAFTNAIRDKIGRFEAANGGTLFLDEIGDISLEVQIKLLRVLQERTFERVGSSESLKVDVRIITATHQDLQALIRQGRFREDLFYRLDVFKIFLSPLRDRIEDVPELALHFLRLYSRRMNKQLDGIEDEALLRLKAFPWPGNVRQLENVIQRAVVVAEKSVVTSEDLPPELQSVSFEHAGMESPSLFPADDEPSPPEAARAQTTEDWAPFLAQPSPVPELVTSSQSDLRSAIQSARTERLRRERERLIRALAAAGGNKAEAARALGMARSTFLSRLKRLGLT